ncbi:MAG TPA: sugar ABC transporter ATP-binding protein [Clostridiales bacterium]|nr:sugar ABC transporter ATP-binding protein [Clostridiales bacterium]
MPDVLLEMKNIHKHFAGVHALNNVSLTIYAGEVHALIGENGAGKSTLMKVLTGIHEKDHGQIFFRGREVDIKTPQEAQALGINMIHQELNLMPHLTVAQNIYIGREPMKGIFLDERKINQMAGELLKSLKIDIDPATRVSNLTIAKQQMVEIAKALSFDSSLLIMDEPSAALTEGEIQELFKFIRDLKARGHSIIYITHRLDELPHIADRITVLRDGQYVDTVNIHDVTKQQIISMMVGRIIYDQPKSKSNVPEDAPVVLEVRNLVAPNVSNVSFTLRRGEILGFAGLMGAGRTETMRAIFGADPLESGEILINRKKVNITSPSDAIAHGISYLSEDRRAFGLAIGLSVKDNAVMANLEEYSKMFFVDDKQVKKVTNEYIEKLSIKTPSITQLVKNLSGGNQQKIVVAKWLIRNSDIFIFDEPTRGIDVGAKSEIYGLIHQLAAENKSIIMVSSEIPELLRMCDRIIVMCEGRVTGELSIDEATQEKIMSYATMNM